MVDPVSRPDDTIQLRLDEVLLAVEGDIDRDIVSGLLEAAGYPVERVRLLVDIGRAAARSPSLRSFLDGMGRLLGIQREPGLEGASRHFSRDILAGLLREVSPADAVIWRTLEGGEHTASELVRSIEEGDEIGRQFSSDLLRVARDFLRRTANRKKPG